MTDKTQDTFYDPSRLDMDRLQNILGEVSSFYKEVYVAYLDMLYEQKKLNTLQRGDQLQELVKFFGTQVQYHHNIFENLSQQYSLDPLLLTALFCTGIKSCQETIYQELTNPASRLYYHSDHGSDEEADSNDEIDSMDDIEDSTPSNKRIRTEDILFLSPALLWSF